MLKGSPVKPNGKNSVFQVFFLRENENQDVEVVEVAKIDFTEVKKRLDKGESIFITRKRKKLESVSIVSREME